MTALSKLDTFIFDLGGVIIDIDPVGCFKQFMAIAPEGAGDSLEKGLQHELLLAYELGNLSTPAFLEEIVKEWQLSESNPEQLIEVWNSMLIGIKPEKIKLLEALQKTHQVLILSNTNHLHRLGFDAIVQEQFGRKQLADFAHKAYYSYEIGLRKPDKAIYLHVLNDMGLRPERSLFFDDNEQNIQSARECGMMASLISHESGIEDWFSQQGFPINTD